MNSEKNKMISEVKESARLTLASQFARFQSGSDMPHNRALVQRNSKVCSGNDDFITRSIAEAAKWLVKGM